MPISEDEVMYLVGMYGDIHNLKVDRDKAVRIAHVINTLAEGKPVPISIDIVIHGNTVVDATDEMYRCFKVLFTRKEGK